MFRRRNQVGRANFVALGMCNPDDFFRCLCCTERFLKIGIALDLGQQCGELFLSHWFVP